MPPVPGLRLRKLADKTTGERVVMFDSNGTRKLVNPDTPGEDHEPWPFAGVQILDDPLPNPLRLSTNIVEQGVHEGWIELEGEREVVRHGGPPGNRRRLVHAFLHADVIVIKTVNGNVRYEVTRQPDKYVENRTDDDPVTDEIYEAGQTIVDKFYDLRLAS